MSSNVGLAEKMGHRSEVVSGLLGFASSRDRLWRVETPEFVGYVTEHDGEITGYSARFLEVDLLAFRFGGDARYVTVTLAAERGWHVREVLG